MIITFIKYALKRVIFRIGYEIKKIDIDREQQQDLLFHFVQQAQKQGRDVNEWLEATQGWMPAQPIIYQLVFPYLPPEGIVCEIGPGVGRQARYLAVHPNLKALHLIDKSAWKTLFLKEYFQANPRVFVHHTNGMSLTCLQDATVDIIFSGGCFISFPLRIFKMYADEFFRVLKPGGVCVINYIDIETEPGWRHFEIRGCSQGGECYTYYTGRVIDRIFTSAGLECVTRNVIDSFSIYLTLRKPDVSK
jgi:SAM-dependent methyltransferase